MFVLDILALSLCTCPSVCLSSLFRPLQLCALHRYVPLGVHCCQKHGAVNLIMMLLYSSSSISNFTRIDKGCSSNVNTKLLGAVLSVIY